MVLCWGWGSGQERVSSFPTRFDVGIFLFIQCVEVAQVDSASLLAELPHVQLYIQCICGRRGAQGPTMSSSRLTWNVSQLSLFISKNHC